MEASPELSFRPRIPILSPVSNVRFLSPLKKGIHMPHGRPDDFAFGAVAAITVTGFVVTHVGDAPYAWLPLGLAAIVIVAISRVLR